MLLVQIPGIKSADQALKIIDYFEIFLERMQLCRRAATVLDARFSLVMNGTKLL